ncbi:hypothetical protein K432DRAFT_315282, partial [Lepidopterella palustris CBS 459.81]
KIILVTLLPYLIHKLQPLNIGYFRPLKHYYSVEVDNFYRYNYIEVNKEYFIKLYLVARVKAFTRKIIYSA